MISAQTPSAFVAREKREPGFMLKRFDPAADRPPALFW
jgi:hypothetical protein